MRRIDKMVVSKDIEVQRLESAEEIDALVPGDVVEIREQASDEPRRVAVFDNTPNRIELIEPSKDTRIKGTIQALYIPKDQFNPFVEVYGGSIDLEGIHVRKEDYLPGTGPFYSNRLRMLRETGIWQ